MCIEDLALVRAVAPVARIAVEAFELGATMSWGLARSLAQQPLPRQPRPGRSWAPFC